MFAWQEGSELVAGGMKSTQIIYPPIKHAHITENLKHLLLDMSSSPTGPGKPLWGEKMEHLPKGQLHSYFTFMKRCMVLDITKYTYSSSNIS